MSKKKSPRSLDTVALDPWRMIAFTDLHVSANTLDRARLVLARVGELAEQYNATIVCLGDFWHQRGHLSVRQLDGLLDEFHRWQGIQTIIIPGNHDQVSVDGTVHGVRVFEAFPNFTIATEPILWEQSKVAFLPWREEPGAQAAMFEALEGDDWTVFAHAEVQGATTNGAHIAPGRVSLKQIEAKTVACYCGHYHARQKLGKHTWYIGSPFEMNFGERGMPHGVAVIEQGTPAPHFIDFEDFPKHHRLIYGGAWDAAPIREQDIVEVHVPPEFMGSERLAEAVESLPAEDIRTLAKEDEDVTAAPSIALSLEEAMVRFIEDTGAADVDRYRLRQLGQAILNEIPEARSVQALSPEVSIDAVRVRDFCGIRGVYDFTFDDGVTLIHGPMGSGKTSLMDGLTWAFFGQTTPRKAGSHGASLRADEVVHDDATECEVKVILSHKKRKREIVVTRTKKRGSGSKVRVTGIKAPDGISDAQALVHAVLGIDQSLWRTCVYLGQGAVGNFVTDADKNRKELLSMAFGLDACPPALSETRTRLKAVRQKADVLSAQIGADEQVIETLQGLDFAPQITQWEAQKKAALEAHQADGESAKEAIAACDHHLTTEAEWLQSKAQHEAHLTQLTDSLAKNKPQDRVPELTRQLGATEAERTRLDHEDRRIRDELRKSVDGGAVCPTCSRPFDASAGEYHIQNLENQLQGLASQKQSFEAKIANLQQALRDAQTQDDAATRTISQQIEESREALKQCGEALNTIAVIKSNRADAERRLSDARIAYVRQEKEVNPFLAKQEEAQTKITSLQSKLAADRVQLEAYQEQIGDLEVWERGFGAKGIPVIVLRGALHELESYANSFLAKLMQGRIFCRLAIEGESLRILLFEVDPDTGKVHERRYEQLSGGQRRCVELAFNPFALGEMVFARSGVRVSTLIVDELTTHLSAEAKPLVCDILRDLNRRSVVVIDHDQAVQSEFDQIHERQAGVGRGEKEEQQASAALAG